MNVIIITLNSNLSKTVTLRYCFLRSSGDASNGKFRYSNGFNLKHERILKSSKFFQRDRTKLEENKTNSAK